MEQNETQEITQEVPSSLNDMPAPPHPAATVSSQAGPGSCPTCGPNQGSNGNGMPSFVYAIGKIEPRFPSLGIEKEYQQTRKGLVVQVEQEPKNAKKEFLNQETQTKYDKLTRGTDQEALVVVLSERNNRYLCRQFCWVLTIEGLDTYILHPHDPGDFDLLVESLRSNPRDTDVDLVIGTRGPTASPEMCNGLMIPMVAFNQIYSFPMASFIKAIPQPKEKVPEDEFRKLCEEAYKQIMQMADNAGASDENRALNYVAVRYPDVYQKTAAMFREKYSLTVTSRPSRLSGTRKVVDVIFTYTDRKTDFTEKHFVRVDVTDEFPFLVSKLSPYYVYDQSP